ncbi:hypothetical protein EYF80_021909 [Liparis tanakae]|uniref:ZP domain-containing protein n=1 Tax=Liparis tanakae TaxID=230148 RepID=A0A4Z2HQM4_9TELE|nr:hypothetical protein EYF80_021909 [Liparis tanakae]
MSTDEGSYGGGYMMWETPAVPCRGLHGTQLNIGLNGELMAWPVAEERGFIVKNRNTTVQISVPYNAGGGYRKSFVTGELHEFYAFHLYLEQILADPNRVETRIRFQRTLSTPLLPRFIFTEDQTVLDRRTFTVYLGDVPEDVHLAAVQLNGQEFTVPFTDSLGHTIAKVVHPNNTLGYTLTVSFDDPLVMHTISEEAVLHYQLDINFTLTVLPENESFYQVTRVLALADVFCLESGISFTLVHQPFHYFWDIWIGSDLLTPELAVQRGYVLSNDSQSLLLEVPLFSHGYEYEDVTLKGFFGVFKILMRPRGPSSIQSFTMKTCSFSSTELISKDALLLSSKVVCSTDGRMTVVADLSPATPSGGVPASFNLVDKDCEPKETDGSRALFSFPLNGCESTIKLDKENVTYQNEIFYSRKTYHGMSTVVSDDATEGVMIQCTYPLAGLHRLFSAFRFESDTVGVGSIIRTTQPTAGPTMEPTAAPISTPASRPTVYMPASHPTARYIKVYRFPQFAGVLTSEKF